MRTTDLIPLILLELNEDEKYGFELTKSIETKSNGKIIIKQPTLYTILKKLEKSKFISSFWQDSDIGGKRHYYNLTDNGRLQVSTLPSFDVLLKHILEEEENSIPDAKRPSPTFENVSKNQNLSSENATESKSNFSRLTNEDANENPPVSHIESQPNTLNENNSTQVNFDFDNITETETDEIKTNELKNNTEESPTKNNDETQPSPPLKVEKEEYKSFSIMDIIANENQSVFESKPNENLNTSAEQAEQIESVVPTDELFKDNSLDNLTEVEINNNNSQILKTEATIKEETFATSQEVQKFTEKESTQLSVEYKEKLKSIYKTNEPSQRIAKPSTEYSTDGVRFVDYMDISKKQDYITAKSIAKNLIYRSLSTAGVLLVLIAISSIITNFTGSSSLFTIFVLVGACLVVFYPTIIALNREKIKLSFEDKKFSIDLKKQAIFCIVVELIILLICIITNIAIGNNTLIKMMSFSNFENFYAPLLLGLSMFADLCFTYIFCIKLKDLPKTK